MPTRNHQTSDVPTRNQISNVPTRNQTSDMPTRNQTSDVPTRNQTSDVPTRNQTSDMPTRNQTIDMPTRNQTSDMPTRNHQTSDMPTRNQTIDMPTVFLYQKSGMWNPPLISQKVKSAADGPANIQPSAVVVELGGNWPSHGGKFNRLPHHFTTKSQPGLHHKSCATVHPSTPPPSPLPP